MDEINLFMKEKILFLLQVPPPVHGAALRNLSLVESTLLKESFLIKLLPLRFADEIKDIGSVSVKKFWRLIIFLFKLIVELIFSRPKFVYFTISPVGNAFFRDVLIVAIIKLFRIPIAYHLRGLGIREEYKKGINRRLYDFVFRNSFVICLSKNHTLDIQGILQRKILIVPNGIKVEAHPLPFNEAAIPQLLFLSNYIKSKGVLDFLEALRILHEKGVPFKSKLIGSPWDVSIEDLRNFVTAHGMSSKVEINEPKFAEEKFNAILDADIFVLPTYYELFPGVVLEAMQCGKPIVSTLTGAIPEIIDDGVNGFLVPTHQPGAVANKIEILIKDPALRKQFGDAAYRKFMDNYTLEGFEQNMKETFEEILKTIKAK
jgi:Glycosyltransferase